VTRPRKSTPEQRQAAERLLALSRATSFRVKVALRHAGIFRRLLNPLPDRPEERR
jgi:hypothetical protein